MAIVYKGIPIVNKSATTSQLFAEYYDKEKQIIKKMTDEELAERLQDNIQLYFIWMATKIAAEEEVFDRKRKENTDLPKEQ